MWQVACGTEQVVRGLWEVFGKQGNGRDWAARTPCLQQRSLGLQTSLIVGDPELGHGQVCVSQKGVDDLGCRAFAACLEIT